MSYYYPRWRNIVFLGVTCEYWKPVDVGDGMTTVQPGGPPSVRPARDDAATAHREDRQVHVIVTAFDKDDIVSVANALATPTKVVAADGEDVTTILSFQGSDSQCTVLLNFWYNIGRVD